MLDNGFETMFNVLLINASYARTYGLRKKSPERCAEEMAMLCKLGYREAILADDIFTSHSAWTGAMSLQLV